MSIGASTRGRRIGNDFGNKDWNMYVLGEHCHAGQHLVEPRSHRVHVQWAGTTAIPCQAFRCTPTVASRP